MGCPDCERIRVVADRALKAAKLFIARSDAIVEKTEELIRALERELNKPDLSLVDDEPEDPTVVER